MNWLDILIVVGLVVPVFIGLKQGLIKSALSLAGLIIGIVLASNFYQPLGRLLGFIPNEGIANIIAFALILIAVMVVASLLAKVLKLAVKVVMLGWVDHIGGGILGFLMGAVSWSILLAVWVKFFGEGLVTESFMAGVLLDKFPMILGLLPSDFDSIRQFFA